jgi:uncharacterized protein YndB with AHSA1/START domain
MATIHHEVSIEAPLGTVYQAIATPEKIGTWWDKQTAVQTDRGQVLEHNPGPEHGVVKMRVVEQVTNNRIEWECISNHPASSPAAAWTGTHFIFELVPGAGNATTLDFRQTGYDPDSKFRASNTSAWADVLQNLKRVVESQPA